MCYLGVIKKEQEISINVTIHDICHLRNFISLVSGYASFTLTCVSLHHVRGKQKGIQHD